MNSVIFGPSVESYYAERAWVPAPERVVSAKKPTCVRDSVEVRYLPDELLGIIHDFSRPLLRYPREYKEALEWTGVREWPELMKKLMDDGVIDVLRKYLTLKEEMRIAKRAQNTYREFGLLNPVADSYEDLLSTVYGKPAPGKALPWTWWYPYSDLWRPPMKYDIDEEAEEEYRLLIREV